MRPVILLAIPLLTAVIACAKAPPSTEIPYTGPVGIGTGPDWNASVDHVEFNIDPDQAGRTISPLIYGYNQISDPGAHGIAALRAGGNRFTAYNWENNASNAGNDHMFQNDGYLVQGATNPEAPGEAVRSLMETARRIGATAVLTVPIVDYVARDKQPGGNVANSGADYLTTRFRQNLPSRGMAAPTGAAPDLSDDFVYQDEFVAWVGHEFSDVPVLYSMDNEPDLWSGTHKEIHPLPVTYDELIKRNTDYARAVKAVRADAPVLGFVSYGWQGYVTLQMAPDSDKGNFIDYYLKKMRAAELSEGRRLIDYLDLHWYPEATGTTQTGASLRIVFAAGDDNGPGMIEARVQAPRSLWDPTYREQSWISGMAGGAISLIPRIQNQIKKNYPGTKLSISEWNYGGGNNISGALATADALGIFGREGVELANVWPSGAEPFTQEALSVFRNFDGAGARFGDTAVSAQTSSIYSSSVYASVDAADPSRLVIVAINKRSEPTTATVRIAGDSTSLAAAVWVLTAAGPTISPGAPLNATEPGTFTYAMPALSVSVLVPAVR